MEQKRHKKCYCEIKMKRKTFIYLLLASIFIFIAVFVKLYLTKSIDRLSNALSMVENRLYLAENEEKKIREFIAYKKAVGDIRKAVRIEPVEFDTRFSSDEFKYKINEIIDSTYLDKGFFFLDSFRIADSSSDEEENKKGSLELSLKGKKVFVFGLKQ